MNKNVNIICNIFFSANTNMKIICKEYSWIYSNIQIFATLWIISLQNPFYIVHCTHYSLHSTPNSAAYTWHLLTDNVEWIISYIVDRKLRMFVQIVSGNFGVRGCSQIMSVKNWEAEVFLAPPFTAL